MNKRKHIRWFATSDLADRASMNEDKFLSPSYGSMYFSDKELKEARTLKLYKDKKKAIEASFNMAIANIELEVKDIDSKIAMLKEKKNRHLKTRQSLIDSKIKEISKKML